MTAMRSVLVALLAMTVAACTKDEVKKHLYHPLEETVPPPVIRQPVLPELLKGCRGHVLVPALGMTFVPIGSDPPPTGAFLREESISAPYRIIPPRARVGRENSPTRLNVEIDAYQRVVGLFCG